MKTKDPLDLSKDAAVDAMIDKARVAMFGKAAFAAYEQSPIMLELRTLFHERPQDWSALSPDCQCAWVAAAQAVLDEAKKAGWM